MEEKKNKFLIKSYKQMFLVIGIFTLVLLIGGTTYAFFNYTRTGSANTLRTGRIYFSTEQTNNNTITLNNIFPMTKEQALADTSTNGTLVVTFTGDTTYAEGIEYLLSIDSVTRTANVPISLIMDVNITENNVALIENANYYTAREEKTASMYKAEGLDTIINDTNHKIITDIETGKYLLAGYIKSGQYGVNGTITIKAFIDADNILITDTPNDQSQRPSTAYTDGTVTTGKKVISTSDWNVLQSTGVSFKVKGEARNGIWVEEQFSINAMYEFPYSVFNDEISEKIKEVYFNRMNAIDMQTAYDNATIKADITYNGEGKVLAWLEPDMIDNTKYIMYVVSDGKTYMMTPHDVGGSVYVPFDYMINIEKIEFNNIDTSRVTTMDHMFSGLSKLKSLDLSSFDTSNVTDMYDMFRRSTGLVTIDLSSFDTSKVVNVAGMFLACSNLTTIYVSNKFDVSDVEIDGDMFSESPNIVGISPNGTRYPFDKTKVRKTMAVIATDSTPGYFTDISLKPTLKTVNAMSTFPSIIYEQRANIKEVYFNQMTGSDMQMAYDNATIKADITDNDEGKVLVWLEPDRVDNTKYIMYVASDGNTYFPSNCAGLFASWDVMEKIEFNNVDMSRVTVMNHLFYNCSKLISVNLSGFGNDSLTSMDSIFSGCTNLKNIDMSGFNFGTSFVNGNAVFGGLTNLEYVNLSNANISKIRGNGTSGMFSGCTSLKTINLANMIFDSSLFAPSMFENCSSLTTIYVSNRWDLSNSSNSSKMFNGCTSLVGTSSNGTTYSYDSSKVDKTMAVIATDTTPGYLTDISLKPTS